MNIRKRFKRLRWKLLLKLCQKHDYKGIIIYYNFDYEISHILGAIMLLETHDPSSFNALIHNVSELRCTGRYIQSHYDHVIGMMAIKASDRINTMFSIVHELNHAIFVTNGGYFKDDSVRLDAERMALEAERECAQRLLEGKGNDWTTEEIGMLKACIGRDIEEVIERKCKDPGDIRSRRREEVRESLRNLFHGKPG